MSDWQVERIPGRWGWEIPFFILFSSFSLIYSWRAILLEGVGLLLCSDARGRKIETPDEGWGFGVLWGDVVPS